MKQKIKLVIGGLAVAIAFAMVAQKHAATVRLQAENNELRAQAAQPEVETAKPASSITQTNYPAEDQYQELLRLRGEVATLRQQKAEAERLALESQPIRPAPAPQDWRSAMPPEQLLKTYGWGPKACRDIADRYAEAWLDQITNYAMHIKLGLALYDAERYPDALHVFQALEKNESFKGEALVWEGLILDLLGRRQEAVTAYTQALDQPMRSRMRHNQYGLQLTKDYVRERIRIPFERVANREKD